MITYAYNTSRDNHTVVISIISVLDTVIVNRVNCRVCIIFAFADMALMAFFILVH